MNQRTDLGTSYLDIVKGAVELFLEGKGREGRDGESSLKDGAGVGFRCFCNAGIALHPPSLRGPPSSLVL